MASFVESQVLETTHCYKCACLFAFPQTLYNRRRADQQSFWCPNGHEQHFTGPSEVSRLKDDLQRKQEMLNAAQERATTMERQRDATARAHQRMRARIQNGVCPCCNRTFQNLLQHMRTEHAEQATLKSLREAFGLTQAALAAEIGVSTIHVSLAEREKSVAGYAKKAIDSWVETQAPSKTKQTAVQP